MNTRLCKLLICLSIGAVGCAATPIGILTPAEKHRSLTENWDKLCKAAGAGPYELDPKRTRTNRGYTACDDFLLLEPREWKPETFVAVEGQPDPVPPHWLSTEEGRFAHSIKLPNPLPNDSGYRDGMSGEEYYKLLCAREAGEFIYEAVKNVDGLFLMRPRPRMSDEASSHLYYVEDPAEDDPIAHSGPGHYVDLKLFRYAEGLAGDYFRYGNLQVAPGGQSMPFVRYEVAGLNARAEQTYLARGIHAPSARYGVIWRGVNRKHGRLMGIAGSETIIFDRETSRVLAFQRFYSITGQGRNRVNWQNAIRCTKYPSDVNAVRRFVTTALVPAGKR